MLITSFFVSPRTRERATKLEKLGLGQIKIESYGRCKRCSKQVILSVEDKSNTYFVHACSKDLPKTVITNKTQISKDVFEFSASAIYRVLEKFLSDIKFIEFSKHEKFWIAKINEKRMPIFLLAEGYQPVSYLYYGQKMPKSQSLIICIAEDQIAKFSTIFSEYNFILIDDVLSSKNTFLDKLIAISTTFESNEAIEISENIRAIQKLLHSKDKDSEFELMLCDWFNELKLRKSDLEEFLEFLKKDIVNPAGAKYVPTGLTSPSDFETILLFDYMNGSLRTDKGYEVKGFASETEFTYDHFDNKCKTNRMRKLLFLVSNNNIDRKVWKELFEYKKTQGSWYHYVFDLDLITLLALGTKSGNFFKKKLVSIK